MSGFRARKEYDDHTTYKSEPWYDGEIPDQGVPAFLLETGLLGEINRLVLHPLGLALACRFSKVTGESIFGPLLKTERKEGIAFDKESLEDSWRKFNTHFPPEEVEVRRIARQGVYGFWIQPISEGGEEAKQRPTHVTSQRSKVTPMPEGNKDKQEQKLTIIFIVNGEDVTIETNVHEPLIFARNKALAQSHNTGRPPEEWDIRNERGEILSPEGTVEDYNLVAGSKLFLTLTVGAGAENARRP